MKCKLGLDNVAEGAGISREILTRSLGPQGNPTVKTLLAILSASGLHLSVSPRVEAKPAPEVSADELKAIREKLKLSRPVFAHYAPIPERWKTGSKAVPSLMHKQRC